VKDRSGLLFCLALLVACGVAVAIVLVTGRTQRDQWEHGNRDPRRGVVWLTENQDSSKVCDGTTLVYRSQVARGHSIAIVPLSPECAP